MLGPAWLHAHVGGQHGATQVFGGRGFYSFDPWALQLELAQVRFDGKAGKRKLKPARQCATCQQVLARGNQLLGLLVFAQNTNVHDAQLGLSVQHQRGSWWQEGFWQGQKAHFDPQFAPPLLI